MFLHQISRLLAGTFLVACLLSGCTRATRDPSAAASSGPVPLAQVVAGSGEPSTTVVAEVRRVVEEQQGALVAMFGGKPRHPFFVHVHQDRDHLPASLAANLHEDSPGFAMLGTHQIHIVWEEMRRTGANLRGVVVHELIHELLDQYVTPHGRLMPRWFHEGLAQSIAGDTYLSAREDELVWRVSTSRLLSFSDLRDRFPTTTTDLRLAYGQSYSYIAWLTREYGLAALLAIAAATDDLTSFERALVGRTGRSTYDLESAWKDHVVHSGAPWRVAFDQCWSLLLIAALPVLVLALMRRLAVDRRAAERLAQSEAAPTATEPDPLQPDGTPEEMLDAERRDDQRSG